MKNMKAMGVSSPRQAETITKTQSAKYCLIIVTGEKNNQDHTILVYANACYRVPFAENATFSHSVIELLSVMQQQIKQSMNN